MENLDKIVDLITDRLMDKIQVETHKASVFVIGAFDIPEIVTKEGYQVVKQSSSADIILVESIGFDAMMRIASLCPLNADEAVVIKSLLKGKKVLVVGASHYCNHSNICIRHDKDLNCSNFFDKNKCSLGCTYFQDCTGGKTKDYNEKCIWMKKNGKRGERKC